MSENLRHLSSLKGPNEGLFQKLSESQNPDEDRAVAKDFKTGSAHVFATKSFYDFLGEDKNKKVWLCGGSACVLAGTQDALREEIKKTIPENEIGEMCCLGRCHENRAFNTNGNNYSGKDADSLESILKGEVEESQENYEVVSSLEEDLLLYAPDDLEVYYGLLKKVEREGGSEALEEIKKSGVRGRGGAGFPMSIKLDACRKIESEVKYIVCNADEGDPGAYSDRHLMERHPHSILFGMLAAGMIVGANTGIVYIRAEYPESYNCMERAIQEFEKTQFYSQINSNSTPFQFHLVRGAGSYVCGEESALLNSIEGLRPEVRCRPPYPVQEGLFGQPTIVNNVETLANIYYILEKGGEAFAKIGTAKSSGSKLVSLDSFFKRPGIYEVPMGTSLQTLVYELAGGFTEDIKAIHIGGPLGSLIPVGMLGDLTLDFESFKEKGFFLGHASFVCVPKDYPLIEYLHHLFDFGAKESCGKCFSCRLGSVRGEELIQGAIKGTQNIDRQLFNDLLQTLEQGSLCALGGMLPVPVKNALEFFPEELSRYFS